VSQWWEAWCTYTKGLSAGDAMEGPPGPIDNSSPPAQEGVARAQGRSDQGGGLSGGLSGDVDMRC
jgi:hypothetical protein